MADRIDTPKAHRRFRPWRLSRDPDFSGRLAEKFARAMGTGAFVGYMTVFIVVWVTLNVIGLFGAHWDPYPFILLNLCFSVQASYAAPLILLAQNRQDDRDRVALEQDRQRAERNLADTEFLARELASLRLAIQDVATRDFVRSELRDLLEELALRGPDPDPEPDDEAGQTVESR